VFFMPMSLLIDEDGRVMKAFSGWSPEAASSVD